jgi:hypothetical protein
VVNVVSQLCGDAGVPVQAELLVNDGKKRIDILAKIGGKDFWMDVSCTHPLGDSNRKDPNVRKVAGCSAMKRAREKTNRWKAVAAGLNTMVKVVPLVAETYGLLCKEFRSLLRDLAKIASERLDVPPLRCSRFRQCWLSRATALVAVAIQRGNAKVLNEAAVRAPPMTNQRFTSGACVRGIRGSGVCRKLAPFGF